MWSVFFICISFISFPYIPVIFPTVSLSTPITFTQLSCLSILHRFFTKVVIRNWKLNPIFFEFVTLLFMLPTKRVINSTNSSRLYVNISYLNCSIMARLFIFPLMRNSQILRRQMYPGRVRLSCWNRLQFFQSKESLFCFEAYLNYVYINAISQIPLIKIIFTIASISFLCK